MKDTHGGRRAAGDGSDPGAGDDPAGSGLPAGTVTGSGTGQRTTSKVDGRGGRLGDLGSRAARGGAEGAHELGRAAESLRLQVLLSGLEGDRALLGHVLGMHLLLHAEGIHGPRETPALVYLFADALAVRPTDDAPMSTVPLLGLHMVLPPLAVARWLYKTGRIAHANVDLVKDARQFEESLATWTVDEFAEADPRLQVYRTHEIDGPVHVYEHLGFARLWVPVPGRGPVRLKSALPATSEAFARLEELFVAAHWPDGVSTETPGGHAEDPPAPPPSPGPHR